MKYTPTDLAGVMIIDLEPHYDDRGFFSRSFCANEFADHGLNSSVAQTNICFNHTPGTLRGLHRQKPPYAEAKLVRCTRGVIVDVAVDVRPKSRTYCKHVIVHRRQPPGTVSGAVFRTWLPDPDRQHRSPSAGGKTSATPTER